MRKWLARLAFSFLILAAVLAWQGHRAAQAGRNPTFHYAAGVILVGLGLAGIRQRHRS